MSVISSGPAWATRYGLGDLISDEADIVQIAEMRDLLDAATSEDELDEYDSPRDLSSNHQGFIFGYSSLKVDLKSLHPSPSQIFILWEVFKENVDPVVKLLHRPTAKNILINAASSVDKVSKPAEALLFAIYFGAVISLTQAQCRQLLDEEKCELMKKYRFAVEQALARADFLNSSSLMCLQAFIFYLVFVRHMDDSRLVWALGGLAIHLAQALGVHRDGLHFGLTPFDTEMRRRLWWHISILDNRSSEDHGTDPTFTEQFYDTKLPLNVNDDDLYPEMTAPPTERVGATEMTFCLIRFELGVFSRRLNLTQPGCNPELKGTPCDKSFEDKEKMIDTCHRRIEERYLQHCDMSVPIFWVSATVARLILAKMWLMVHHPRSFMMDHQGQPLPSETKDRLFVTSTEVIEFSYLLERNENTAKWGWLFRTYMQWQSVAFVLSEICVREPGVEVDRAWRAIESVYNDHFVTGRMKNHKGMLWRPMRHLMAKAKAVRAKQVKAGRAQPSQVQGLNQQYPTSVGSVESPTSQQPQFDFQTDPWAQHLGAATNIMGATAEALDMDFDIAGLMSPQTSEGSGSQPPQPQQQKQKQLPRAMSTVYGKQNPLKRSQSWGEQMQGLVMPQSQSPTLSISSDFGIFNSANPNGNGTAPSPDFGGGVGTTAADLGIGGPPAATADMGIGMDGVPSGDFTFNSPAFLNWGGWNPGVGDFNVAPITPDPMAGYWGNGQGQGQQEWY